MRDSSPRSRHKLLGTGISDILEEQGVSRRGGTAHLHTGGSKPLPVTVGTPMVKSKPPPYFTADKIKRLQVILGESDKKTLKIANFLRVEGGKKCVEPGLSQSLTERNSRLNQHFKGVMRQIHL